MWEVTIITRRHNNQMVSSENETTSTCYQEPARGKKYLSPGNQELLTLKIAFPSKGRQFHFRGEDLKDLEKNSCNPRRKKKKSCSVQLREKSILQRKCSKKSSNISKKISCMFASTKKILPCTESWYPLSYHTLTHSLTIH